MELPERIPLKVLLPALGGAVFILLVLLLITAVSGRSRESEVVAPAPVLDLEFSDFIVDDPTPLADPGWLPVRPARNKWEPEEIDQFWVDPVELGIQRLEEENDEMVRDFFEAIP